MKKEIAGLLAAALLLTLAACGAPPAAVAEPTAVPEATAEPTPAPTAEPTPEPTPAPTPEPTPLPFEKGEESTEYSVMPTVGMSEGGKMLMYWLLGDGMLATQSYLAAELGEPLFTLPDAPVMNAISYAEEGDGVIGLAVDPFIADCGLLESLLSAFEATYGYTVEVYVGSGETAVDYLRAGLAELVIADNATYTALRGKKLVNATYPFADTVFVSAEEQ